MLTGVVVDTDAKGMLRIKVLFYGTWCSKVHEKRGTKII